MLIPISASPNGTPEWAIIEWQGDVEHRPEHEPNEDGSMDVGQLSQTEQGVFQLRIGYHLLEGKQVKLAKPLAVLESQPMATIADGDSGKEYHVVGVIRSKLLFKSRPKPMISKPLKQQAAEPEGA